MPDLYATFAGLHRTEAPLVLVNVWDAGSAKAAADAGSSALATGSWSVAAAHGFTDGEHIPLDLVLANLARITQAVDLPVSVDLERGYGESPSEAAATVKAAQSAGAIGVNLEDALSDTARRTPAGNAERLAAIRAAVGAQFWINARTDVFFQTDLAAHAEALDEVVERAAIYAAAGANSLFVPGLSDSELIRELATRASLPLNVMAMDASAVETFRGLGVARISMGPGPYLAAMQAVSDLVAATRAAR